mmetsp:Transcript_14366/g.16087  ORF Transcript_14366/g.16087 Transcript_14366/m.16087 type:complete len:177 (-) Transcript_14366:43-573(-)
MNFIPACCNISTNKIGVESSNSANRKDINKEQDRGSGGGRGGPVEGSLLQEETDTSKRTQRCIDFQYEHGNEAGVYGYHDAVIDGDPIIEFRYEHSTANTGASGNIFHDPANEGGIKGSRTSPRRKASTEGGSNNGGSTTISRRETSTILSDQKKKSSSPPEYSSVYFFLHKMNYR